MGKRYGTKPKKSQKAGRPGHKKPARSFKQRSRAPKKETPWQGQLTSQQRKMIRENDPAKRAQQAPTDPEKIHSAVAEREVSMLRSVHIRVSDRVVTALQDAANILCQECGATFPVDGPFVASCPRRRASDEPCGAMEAYAAITRFSKG